MGVMDWDAWMKERGIYIPTEEEAIRAIVLGQKKVKVAEAYAKKFFVTSAMASREFEAYKKRVADSR